MMKNKILWRSFAYAWNGIKYAFAHERNMKLHLAAGCTVFALAWWFSLERLEVMILSLAVTSVFVTEMINTAMERVVDLVSPELHPVAKTVKDVAAGAVLIASFFAAFIGCLLFADKIFG